jgi:Plasmid encoded RepA protein
VRRFMLEGKTEGAHGRQVALRERTSFDEDGVVLSADGRGDPQFLHAVLCQLGLPRNPTPSKTFERRSGRAHLSLQAGRTFDGMKFVDQPLPSGTRPRLVLINLCSESVRARDRTVNIGGSTREFLRRLNIDPGGESMAQFRKQMLALSCCRMTLGMMTANGPAQVNAEPIEGFQAWHTDEDGQQTLWPGYIRLTEKFFDSLMEHAVPLEADASSALKAPRPGLAGAEPLAESGGRRRSTVPRPAMRGIWRRGAAWRPKGGRSRRSSPQHGCGMRGCPSCRNRARPGGRRCWQG